MTTPEAEDPRVARNRRAVQAAALQVLGIDGVSGLTVDRLADVSGVSRSTIYRHWPDMAELIVEAFDEVVHDHSARPPLTGDVAADLLAYLRDYARRLNDPTYTTVIIALIEWSWRDAAFAATHARTFADSRSRAAALLRAAREAGLLSGDVDVSQGVEDVVSPFLYRRLVLRRTIGERDVLALHARLLGQWLVG